MSTKPHSQSGFSLVSILVIMGVVLASILMISQAKFNQQGTQKALKIKQSYTDVNQSLINDVVTEVHRQLKANGGGCANTSSLNNRKLDGNKLEHSFFRTPLAKFNPKPPTDHKNAHDRCMRPTNPPAPQINRFYFCTSMSRDTTAPRDSIMNARVAFAEFSIELIDLQTQQPISCAQYNAKAIDPKDGSAGMTVTMVLYWENDVGAQKANDDPKNSKSTFSQKALSYIANQNN